MQNYLALSDELIAFVDHVPSLSSNSETRVAEIDGSTIDCEQDLLKNLASSLSFPDYFGMNWDAVDECFLDLAEREPKSHLLLVRSAYDLWQSQPSSCGKLISAVLLAQTRIRSDHKLLRLVFVLDQN
jgi:hypothetical protein